MSAIVSVNHEVFELSACHKSHVRPATKKLIIIFFIFIFMPVV